MRLTRDLREQRALQRMVPGALSGRVESASLPQRAVQVLKTHRRAASGGGRQYATIVIAASNSSAAGKASADVTCDGTDDVVEINQAFLDLASSPAGAGSVTLLEGVFDLGTAEFKIAMQDNCALLGQGHGTVIRVAPGQAGVSFVTTGCHVADLRVVASGTATADELGVEIYGGDVAPLVERVWCDGFSETGGVGFSNVGAGACAIVGCRASNCEIGYFIGFDECLVEDSIAQDCSVSGVHVVGDDCLIVGNLVIGGGVGIHFVSAFPPHATDNLIISPSSDGILLDTPGPSGMLSGNAILNAGGVGINLQSGQKHLSIFGNLIEGCQYEGVLSDSTDEVYVYDNAVVDCGQAAANTYAGISIDNGDGSSVQANNVRGTDHKYGVHVKSGASTTFCTNNDVLNGYTTAGIQDDGTATVTAAGNRL